jgi:hypothetical protein
MPANHLPVKSQGDLEYEKISVKVKLATLFIPYSQFNLAGEEHAGLPVHRVPLEPNTQIRRVSRKKPIILIPAPAIKFEHYKMHERYSSAKP